MQHSIVQLYKIVHYLILQVYDNKCVYLGWNSARKIALCLKEKTNFD